MYGAILIHHNFNENKNRDKTKKKLQITRKSVNMILALLKLLIHVLAIFLESGSNDISLTLYTF